MKLLSLKWFAIIGMLLFFSVAVAPSAVADDTTPPITVLHRDPSVPTGNNGWDIWPVEIILTATDNESGVNATYYRINNETWAVYTNPFEIESDGIYYLEYYSIDNAGNSEIIQSKKLRVDQTCPIINSYFKSIGGLSDLQILFRSVCEDTLSGVDYVEFLLNDVVLFSDDEPPYEWIYSEAPALLETICYDKAGNQNFDDNPQPLPIYTVCGFIRDLNITKESISFHALFCWTFRGLEPIFIINKIIVHTDTYSKPIVHPHFVRVKLWFFNPEEMNN